MAVIQAQSHEQLARLRQLVEKSTWGVADEVFRDLVAAASKEQLRLLEPDLRQLAAAFHKRRQSALISLLDDRLHPAATPQFHLEGLLREWSSLLDGLRDKHIFQWNSFYHDNIRFIMREAHLVLRNASERTEIIDDVERIFSKHATEIYERGFMYARGRDLPQDIVHSKSLHGLRQFLYLLMNLLIAQRETIRDADEAALAWDLASAMLRGVLSGYADAKLGDELGVQIMARNLPVWLPALGFVRGSEALQFLGSHCQQFSGVLRTVGPALFAIQQQSTKKLGSRFIVPGLSRVGIGVSRLDITFSVLGDATPQDFLVCCFYDDGVDQRALAHALGLRAALIVGSLEPDVREWAESRGHEQIADAYGISTDNGDVENLAELAAAVIANYISGQLDSRDPTLITINHAQNFPLDDPQFRQLLTVERYSVRRVFSDLEKGTGVYVWCSVRRSGKTTAASTLEDGTDTQVIFQTMDHRPAQPDQNVLERKMSDALEKGVPIPPDFFSSIVAACQSAAPLVRQGRRKTVFILDEYETLFSLLQAYGSKNLICKLVVVQPLLSQMLSFSQQNVLILMGQRPDAHAIFLEKNQLSPSVREHSFPLFSHQGDLEGAEFVQFLQNVLSPRLGFSPEFANAVHKETNGHPYLTVNLMTDFCDWLIEKQVRYSQEGLQANTFVEFSRERLTTPKLARSPHYQLFQKMLSQYLAEQMLHDSPWLYAVTWVIREIAKAYPSKLKCALKQYRDLASKYVRATDISADRLLSDATFANFLRESGGQVSLGIPLMGRLAATVNPRIN